MIAPSDSVLAAPVEAAGATDAVPAQTASAASLYCVPAHATVVEAF